MGLGKPLPYINGGVAVVLGLLISFFLWTYSSIVDSFAALLPSPLTMSAPAAVVVFGLIVALVIKLLDRPLGSGRRFAHLEHSLAHRKGVTNPRALAAYIGRNKYGSAGLARLSAKGKRRR